MREEIKKSSKKNLNLFFNRLCHIRKKTKDEKTKFISSHFAQVMMIFFITVIAITLVGKIVFAETKQVTVNVKYFYPKNGTQNPGGSDPNWFYYWNQVCGDTSADYDSSMPSTIGGQFRPGTSTTTLFIGPGVGTGTNAAGHTGIDCFCATIMHESTHRTHYNETNGTSPQPDADDDWLKDTDETNGDLNLNGVLDTEDTNGNGILDAGEDVGLERIELTLSEFNNGQPPRNVPYGMGNGAIDRETGTIGGSSRYHANTNGGPYDDEDDSCYAAGEHSWTAGSVDNQDWAHSGKQWP